MAKKFFKGKKRIASKSKKRVASKSKKQSFNRAVKSVIKSMAEKKHYVVSSINNTLITGGTTTIPPYVNLMPQLNNGTGAEDRIGNEVRVTKAKITGYINLLPYDVALNPFPSIQCRLIVFSYKRRNNENNNSQTMNNTTDWDDFFETGSSSVPPQGNILDIINPVNKTCYTVHYQRTFKLTLGGSSTAYSATAIPQDGAGSYQKRFTFDYSKKVSKLLFDDTGLLYPTNRNIFMAVFPIRSDGGASEAIRAVELHYRQEIEFIDM